MRIRYTITTTSCPNCGRTLKMENTLVDLFLTILLFPLAIIYVIYFFGRTSLEGKLAYIPHVGNPFKKCPQCGTRVKINDKKSYEELSPAQRYIYQNRAIFQTCYITKAMAIVFGLTSLLIFSDTSLDFIVACISIPMAVVSFCIFQISKKKCQELTNNAKLKEKQTIENTDVEENKFVLQNFKELETTKTNEKHISKENENKLKEIIYINAIERVKNSPDEIAYQKSILELQSIIDYRDSDKQIEYLNKKLDSWYRYKEEKSEQERIYAENQHLQQQPELEEQKVERQRRKQTAIIIIIVVLAILIPVISVISIKDLNGRNWLKLSKGDGYYIVEGAHKIEENLIIPSSYKGLPIKEISPYAFDGETKIKSVQFADNITKIGQYAFRGCTSLTNVIFGESSCLTYIGNGSFDNCGALTEITLPNNLTSIDFRAFADCDSLKEIVIPSSVTNIGEGVFASCNSLTNILVQEKNLIYKSLNGNLYNKQETTLIQYAIGKNNTYFYVPNSVTIICKQAFYDCDYLKEIVVSNGVKTIEGHAFYSCSALTKIVIPSSVKSIGWFAFYECTKALTIYCESLNAPYGWDDDWNPSGCSVVWHSSSSRG